MARKVRIIVQNIFKETSLYQKIAEGVFESLILFILMSFIPFTKTVRWIIVISLIIFVMIIILWLIK